ncbi:hypothetical protein COC46_13500 [Bacillus sp. AFS041924]|nr:hypothetical protein COC46_13500 [Bacillus sp. AFS041924]
MLKPGNKLKIRKEELEKELLESSNNSKKEKLNELENLVNKIKLVTKGDLSIANRETNDIFREVIERIEYKRVGDHTAETHLTIFYK